MDVSFCGIYSSNHYRSIEETAEKISGRSLFSQIWLCGLVIGLSTIVFLASPLTPHLSESMRWLLGIVGLAYSVFALLWYSSWDQACAGVSLPELEISGRVTPQGILLATGGESTVYLWEQIVACQVTDELAFLTLNTGASIAISRDFFETSFDWEHFLSTHRHLTPVYKKVPTVSKQEILFWLMFLVSTCALWYSVMFS
ncbi:MAG: YcxB family protein [bacterium]|nr:YcxB family protein [bacterium]